LATEFNSLTSEHRERGTATVAVKGMMYHHFLAYLILLEAAGSAARKPNDDKGRESKTLPPEN